MTKFLKKDQLSSNWYEIDAKNAVVGRLATVVSKIIREKTKLHLHHIWMMVILL
jgi:large subunit ribosomal protein L13